MKRKHRYYDTWEELIEAKTHPEGDCLIWDGGTHSQSYPMIRWDGKMVQVVRQQVEERRCQKLDGRRQRVKNMTCENVLCVNPDHYIVADYGSEEWKCVVNAYSEKNRKNIIQIYNDYTNPKTGTKYGSYHAIKAAYPGISNTTIGKILKNK